MADLAWVFLGPERGIGRWVPWEPERTFWQRLGHAFLVVFFTGSVLSTLVIVIAMAYYIWHYIFVL